MTSTMAEEHIPAGPRLTVVHATSYHFPPGWDFAPEVVPYSLVRLITAGSAEFVFDGDRRHVRAGDVVLIPEGTLLECHSNDGLTFMSIRFTTSLTVRGRDLLADGFAVPIVSRVTDPTAMRWHFEALVEQWRHPTPARSFLSVGHLHLILGTLLAEQHEGFAVRSSRTPRRHRVTSRTPDARMEKVIDHLSRHTSETIDAATLVHLVHMSESTLRRTFRRYTGKTVGDYHREQRMVAAAEALLLTDAAVSAIAQDTGYEDPSYFTRVFRSVFGVSPAAYRRAARQA